MDPSLKTDYRELCRLENQNYQLKQELQDLRAKYDNLKKQQQIWDQIHRHNMPSQQQVSSDSQQLCLIKEQFVAIVKQKQQQQQCIKELRQKVEDMKYTMQEMRQLSEKQQRIHLREVELFEMEKHKYQLMLQDAMIGESMSNSHGNSRDRDSMNVANSVSINKLKTTLKQVQRKLLQAKQRISQLQDQLTQQRQSNIKNQQKLQKCSQIAKEMQQYYNNQLETKQQLITQLQQQLGKYIYDRQSRNFNYELPSPHSKLPSLNTNQDCSSLKCSSIVSEYHHQQLLMGNHGEINFFDQKEKTKEKLLQDKYRDIIEDIKNTHNKEITSYLQKINYLTLKAQALQAEKSYLLKNTTTHNLSNMSHFSQSSQTFILPQNLQSIQILNPNQQINKSIKNPLHHQSVNLLKLSNKSSANDSFNQLTPKSQISQSVVRENSRNHKGENIANGARLKLTAVKTPNKPVQKSLNLAVNRNSCSYQRRVLAEKNSGDAELSKT